MLLMFWCFLFLCLISSLASLQHLAFRVYLLPLIHLTFNVSVSDETYCDLITVTLKIHPVVGLLGTSVAFLSDPKGDVFWE